MNVRLKVLLFLAPQKFNTFNTFTTFAIFANFKRTLEYRTLGHRQAIDLQGLRHLGCALICLRFLAPVDA